MNISSRYYPSSFTPQPGVLSRPGHTPERDPAHPVSTDSPSAANAGPPGAQSRSPLSPVIKASATTRADFHKTGADAEKAVENQRQAREEQLIQSEIKMLAARDREVRTHEQAHMAAGGQYAGAATYQYQRGPNGVNYAVGGEVPISTSKEATPEATLRKAQIIRRAALAPAEPSPQDRKVAAMAMQMESAARTEIARERKSQVEEADVASADRDPTARRAEESDAKSALSPPENSSENPDQTINDRLQRIYRQGDNDHREPGTLLSLRA